MMRMMTTRVAVALIIWISERHVLGGAQVPERVDATPLLSTGCGTAATSVASLQHLYAAAVGPLHAAAAGARCGPASIIGGLGVERHSRRPLSFLVTSQPLCWRACMFRMLLHSFVGFLP